MLNIIVAGAAFLLGAGLGGAGIVRQVRAGRVVIGGRIYFCRDTGPVIR